MPLLGRGDESFGIFFRLKYLDFLESIRFLDVNQIQGIHRSPCDLSLFGEEGLSHLYSWDGYAKPAPSMKGRGLAVYRDAASELKRQRRRYQDWSATGHGLADERRGDATTTVLSEIPFHFRDHVYKYSEIIPQRPFVKSSLRR
jgi:hypothetical protein